MARTECFSNWTDEEFKKTATLMGRDWEVFKAECLEIERVRERAAEVEAENRAASIKEFFRGLSTEELLAECTRRGLHIREKES